MEHFLTETIRCLEEQGYDINSVSRIIDTQTQKWVRWETFKAQTKFHYVRSGNEIKINPYLQLVLRDGTKFIRHSESTGFESWVYVPSAFATTEVDELQYHF